MTYTIISAQYANENNTAAVIRTEEAGAVLLSEKDTPDEWAAMLAWGTPDAFDPPEIPSAITYKADIWRRATDGEAETIVAVLGQQSIRKQRLFNDATVLNHADPEFAELKAGFVQAFGPARADELLAPSE